MVDLEEVFIEHAGLLEMTFDGMLKMYPGMAFQPMFVVLTENDGMQLVDIGFSEDGNMPQHVFNMAVVVRGYLMTQHIDVSAILFAVDTYTWNGDTEEDCPPVGMDELGKLFRQGHPKVREALYVVCCDKERSLDCFLPYRRLTIMSLGTSRSVRR